MSFFPPKRQVWSRSPLWKGMSAVELGGLGGGGDELVWGNGKQKEMGRFGKETFRGEVGGGYKDTSHHIYQSGE